MAENNSFYTGNVPPAFQGEIDSLDIEEQLNLLKNSYIMYERSKAEVLDVRSKKKDKYGNRIYSDKSIKKTLALMENAQNDIKTQFIQLGGKEEDLPTDVGKIDRRAIKKAIHKAEKEDGKTLYDRELSGEDTDDLKSEAGPIVSKKSSKQGNAEPIITTIENYKAPAALYDEVETTPKNNKVKTENKVEKIIEETEEKNVDSEGIRVSTIDGRTSYDAINLPSKGECYRNKQKTVDVSYLTAYDENLILSPNLYRNGTFLDHILKNKVKNFNPDDLIQGDRDAIIIWLRASGYGNEYPVSVVDEATGKEFDTVVDLSQLKYRKFTLKGDENGYFNFTLPVTGDEIKFKFLTNRDTKKLQDMRNQEDKEYRATMFRNSLQRIEEALEDNDLFEEETQEKLLDAVDVLRIEGVPAFESLPETEYSHEMTNRLILSTVSVNGNTDRKFIVDYILNLNVRDAKAYREYIFNNEPGIEYNIKVKRPDSLGGGYMNTFLRLDQFIFASKV